MSEQEEIHRLYKGYRKLRMEEKGKTTKTDYDRFLRSFDEKLLVHVEQDHKALDIQRRFMALGDEHPGIRESRCSAFLAELRRFLLDESSKPTSKPTRETSDHPLFGLF